MKRLLFPICIFFTCAISKAQVNLVKNPGFEQYSQCPDNFNQIAFAYFWSAIDSNAVLGCIPELCHTCSQFGTCSVPDNGTFHQNANHGNALAQIISFFDDSTIQMDNLKRDYLQGRLSSTLTNGQSYCVSFYVNMAEMSRYAIDRIGAYLDDGSIDTASLCGLPQTLYTPQVQHAGGVINDTANWVKVQGSFVANGTERFITLGNFYDVDNTQFIELPDNNYNWGGANDHFSWFLIDDVSVIESDLPAYAGPDVWVAEGDSIFIGRTPEVGLECYWYVNSNVVDSGAGFYAKPDTTTTYVVQQTLCGQVETDTVIVSVFPVSVNGITNSRQLSIYPNPASSVLHVMQERVVFSEAIVINSVGQQVATHVLDQKETAIDISSLPAGVYYLQLNGERGRELRSFVKAPSAP